MHPANSDPCILLTPAIEIAIEAGRSIMEIYESDFAVEHKDDDTPLTAADTAAHRIIASQLAELTPDLPILSEECDDISFEERSSWQRYWLVDPLDGTREFVKRNDEFTVNIALIDQHEPVLGIVYAPVLGVYYYACRGQGAWKRDTVNLPEQLYSRPWEGGHAIIAGSRSHRGTSLEQFLANLGDYELIPMGSALKSCLVAEGKADIYPRLGPTSEWDTAAAQCIVEEAGGRITDTAMQPLRYNTKESLLNPHFFACGDINFNWSKYL
ncbi:MAG: 3'(2'),5'-bisphosphate nucleotidase CysQ [Thiohalomonadaceae bacterium]|jgi:3'(2'), 5'-bisphosphate nucleotidase